MTRKLTLFAMLGAFVLTGLAGTHAQAAHHGKKIKLEKKHKIYFMAGNRSHGYGAHEFNAGSLLMKKLLEAKYENLECVVYKSGTWPKDVAKELADADSIVIFANGGGGHPANRRLKELDVLMKKGIGMACLHYGVEVPKGDPGKHMLEWIGGYFETHWSVNPHWVAKALEMQKHPVTQGVKPFEVNDEWYFHMRFREKMKGVTPVLSAIAPDATMKRKDGAHSGNPAVRKAVANKEPQHLGWVYQRGEDYGNGRGFGFTGLHYHWNYADDNFRKLVLNGVAWTAKLPIPDQGIVTPTPTREELEENQDYPKKGQKKPQPRKKKADAAGATGAAGGVLKNVKPAFKSKVVNVNTAGHAVAIEADIKGARSLVLVADDGGNGYSCDWCTWAEPRLITADGKEKKLTELKWTVAEAGHGRVNVNKNCGGNPLFTDGKPVTYGIGTHANSLIAYELPKGHDFVAFKARGALDQGGTGQGNCGKETSVQFAVYAGDTSVLAFAKQQKKKKADTYVKNSNAAGRSPEESLEGLDVHDKLQAELFAYEPAILSPSNIDIDHAGRVWVCEIVNYRKHRGRRPEGDRILILEDSNGDGKADKQTVFYQGKDIDSPHGVCVLATPDFKNTKVIVSAGETVFVFTDKDGDGKADDKKILFQKISGAQHDHGIHAFVFGPDGKLYFNFGNAGKRLIGADGKPVIDKAGNKVEANRKPYQEGLVFRCDLDGSNVETLGWNFRNNWMATVDSYGTIWQSDNDDDGNRGVRINFVMEFGNYGYKDEFTGAGWRTKRTNMEKEIPLQHWHLNDPGVVPNLLQTGAGSPTGITVYEGALLPKVFQGQVIHTDAGPNVCRAYPVKDDGAGYSASIENILVGTRDRWFRPADVAVAPDGSLIIADWYDPGVGGHNMRDLERGRLFRVTPEGHKGYKTPSFDFSTVNGAIEAMKNPNYAVRFVAWQALNKAGSDARKALEKMAAHANPIYRARAIWLIAKTPDAGGAKSAIALALKDDSEDIRGMAVRIARQDDGVNQLRIVNALLNDKSAQVRRECAIALRHLPKGTDEKAAAKLWAKLAAQHDGKDRWYLEALGIAANLHADAYFEAYLSEVGGADKALASAGGRDIIWRVRATAALPLLVKAAKAASAQDQPRYVRALDFHPKGPAKDAALLELLQ